MFDLFMTLTEASYTVQEGEAAAIERAQRDPAEFSAIYCQYVDRVFYYILAKADSRGDAEDITAQVFLDALENLPRYRHRGHFAAWLFTIARHRLADFYRQNRAERLNADPGRRPSLRPSPTGLATTGSAPTEGVDPLGEIIEVEHLERLAKLVAGLNENERELLRLRFAAGLNFAEIAELQGRKESAIKMSIYRLLARLKSQMEAGHALTRRSGRIPGTRAGPLRSIPPLPPGPWLRGRRGGEDFRPRGKALQPGEDERAFPTERMDS